MEGKSHAHPVLPLVFTSTLLTSWLTITLLVWSSIAPLSTTAHKEPGCQWVHCMCFETSMRAPMQEHPCRIIIPHLFSP